MSQPTRARRFPDLDPADEPSIVLRGNESYDPGALPPVRRPHVLRSVVDRRQRGRRAEDVAAIGHTRMIAQSDPEELLALDERLRHYFDSAIESARAEGYAEGRAEATARSRQIAEAIGLSTAELTDFSATDRRIAVNAVIDLAERIATIVIGRNPHDNGAAALTRIRQVLTDLDDSPFTVSVHPDDLDIVSAGVNGDSVIVAADVQLLPGEARIRGPWSYSDMTHATVWEAIRTALEAPDDAGNKPRE